MRGENFVYFATICGFFIGVSYSILTELDILDFLIATFVIMAVFYIIVLGGVAFFVKYLDIKQIVYFDKTSIDDVLNIQIQELEKNENFIFENYKFIQEIEKEEIEIIRKQRKNV